MTRHGDLSITVCLALRRLDGAGRMLSTRGADMEIKESCGGRLGRGHLIKI